jgi:hypothetical protein
MSFGVAKMIVKILKEIEQDDFKILRDAIDWNDRWNYLNLTLKFCKTYSSHVNWDKFIIQQIEYDDRFFNMKDLLFLKTKAIEHCTKNIIDERIKFEQDKYETTIM